MTERRPRSWPRWILRAIVLFAVVPYLAVTAILITFQRRLIFQPTKVAWLSAAEFSSPGEAITDVELTTDDGLTLHGWRFAAINAETPRRLVIYFPGNAGCRRDRLADCADFTRLGCDVILFDYRGYGDNAGSPTEAKLAADAQAIWRLATGPEGYSPAEIVLFGESMGGGVATRLAAECAQRGEPVAALILNSTFASLADTAAWHYPALPVRFLVWDRFPSVDRIPHVACPVLQFHGTADSIVPCSEGQRLFAAAPKRSAAGIESRFVPIPGGEHNFISMHDMSDAVDALFHELRTMSAKSR